MTQAQMMEKVWKQGVSEPGDSAEDVVWKLGTAFEYLRVKYQDRAEVVHFRGDEYGVCLCFKDGSYTVGSASVEKGTAESIVAQHNEVRPRFQIPFWTPASLSIGFVMAGVVALITALTLGYGVPGFVGMFVGCSIVYTGVNWQACRVVVKQNREKEAKFIKEYFGEEWE